MIQPVDKFLYRGPRPENMDELKQLEVKTILSLQTGAFEFFHNKQKEEERQAAAASITYLHRSLSDLLAPSSEEVQWCLDHINSARALEEVLFVHCLRGCDRTGFICAAYRVKVQGWTVDAAIQEWKEMGLSWFYQSLGWIRSFRKMMGEI